MSRYALSLALCLCATSRLRAEVLAGPVDLRAGRDRKPVAHLENGVRVDAAVARGKWVTIGTFVVVDAGAMSGCCTLKAGQTLVGADGQRFGVTTDDIATEGPFTDQTTHKQMLYVSGEVPAKAVPIATSVEYAMAKILNDRTKKGTGPIARADLETHLKAFPYEPWFDEKEMTSMYIPDLPGPSGGRFFVFFYNDRLVAVMFYRRMPLTAAGPTKPTRLGMWVYVDKVSPEVKKQMEGYYFPIIAKAN
jgi:hypothetical protein